MTMRMNFHWETFQEWLSDFCEVAPEDFTTDDYRIGYDCNSAEGYAPSTLRIAPSRKRREEDTRAHYHATEAALAFTQDVPPRPTPKLNGISDLQRMLFTAELTSRLHAFKTDQTFDELVREAAEAANIELR